MGAAVAQRRSRPAALPGGPGALDSTLFMAAREEPSLIAGMDRAVLGWLSYGHELWLLAALSLVCALIALLVVAEILPRVALGAAIALNLVFWVVGQNLGGMLSGSGTDLGTAPPLMLFALVLWPRPLGLEAPADRAATRTTGDYVAQAVASGKV